MKKILLPLLMVVAVLSAYQLSAQTQINQSNISSFPYYISQPGSYILTSNITVTSTGTSAIFITASNVVLNMNGYSVTGPFACTGSSCNSNLGSVGIENVTNNVTIENGSISGFYYGIFSEYGNIHDLQFSSCAYCIYASNAIIRHNTVTGGAVSGIYAQTSTVSENVVTQAYSVGISGMESSILNNTVTQTTGGGLEGNNSSVINNTVTNSSSWGIVLYGGYAGGNTSINNANNDLDLYSNAVSTKNNGCTKGAC